MALSKKDLETIAAMMQQSPAEAAVSTKPKAKAKGNWSECVSFPYGKGTVKSATRDGLGALSVGYRSVYVRDLAVLDSVEACCKALRKALK